MKFLVTGANGFIGKALTLSLLKDGHIVYAVTTDSTSFDNIRDNKLFVLTCFFDQYNSIADLVGTDIDCVIHLAWAGLSGASAYDVTLQTTNVLATSVLVDQIIKLKAKKFVFVSSMNTLEIRDMLAHPESHNPRPVSVHVASKINAEIVARTKCYQNNIEFNTALLAMVYGENNHSKMITNIVINNLLKGISPKLITGNNVYDLVYVSDVVSGLKTIAEKGKNKKTYYVGHSENKTFRELFTKIGEIVNPKIVLLFGEFPDDNAINFDLVDRTLLTKDTGWKPEADFEKSILSTANWIKFHYEK